MFTTIREESTFNVSWIRGISSSAFLFHRKAIPFASSGVDDTYMRCEYEKSEPIFLIAEELMAIEDLDTKDNSGMLLSKSIFLVGCYTSQRISDLSAMRKKDLVLQTNGEMWWEVHQVKGRKFVKVYLVEKARKIQEKYLQGKNPEDRVFPPQSSVIVNRNLKKIGKAAGLTEIVTKVSYSGNLKKEVVQPKYKFLTTHTARKTAISLMCTSNMPDHEIQSISGHSSSKEMAVYKGVDRKRVKEGLIALFDAKRA